MEEEEEEDRWAKSVHRISWRERLEEEDEEEEEKERTLIARRKGYRY